MNSTKRWTLLTVCLATFMLLLDITVVNVALPDIQRELKASFTDLQWVVDAYSLMLASVLLTAGSLADLFGRKRVFIIGLVLFTVASLLCGLAGSPTPLNLARGFQGVGGAVMFACAPALLAQEFEGRERGTAFGIWGATIGAAVAVGPLVGGALTESLGWEWIFFVNVPIGALTAITASLRLHEYRPESKTRVDWAGVVTFSGALFCLVFALIRGNDEGWGSTTIVGLLVAALALMVGFIVAERHGRDPMLDLSLFRKPAFTGAQIVAFAISASMFSMFLYLTLYMQNVLDYSPLEAGLRFLPVSVVSFFAAPVAGRLTSRVPIRLLLFGGLCAIGGGLLLMGGLSPSSKWTALLAGFLIAGTGVGFVNAPLSFTAVSVVEQRLSGTAAGINNTFRQVGIATGIAGLGAIFQTRVTDGLHSALAGTSVRPGDVDRLGQAVVSGGARQAIQSAPSGARDAVAEAARRAFIDGINDLFIIAALVAFAGAAAALVLVRSSDLVPQGPPQPAPAAAAEESAA
jgi:EmrB/QacA subfamily drug resistance transporter